MSKRNQKDTENGPAIKKPKLFNKNTKVQNKRQPLNNKLSPEDWNEFKKKKKELRLKRKQRKGDFDVIHNAKLLGEKLRLKNLKGGDTERNKLLNELHNSLKGKELYAKFVLAHDTSRVVQWLLKYGSDILKEQISKELIPGVIDMMQSKYGIFAIKRLLKYGNQDTRKAIIDSFYGHAVKLASHAISAPVFEYAYHNWATPVQKQHLIQEFYGDMYKNSKDDNVKHLKDVFESSPGLKDGVLGAIKANLNKILNKGLLDSGLVQTVIYEFLKECNEDDKQEIISQLVPHIVVISNSKEGSRAAMQMIWFGTNKDRKSLMKNIKEHLIELCKHEHGHCTIITLLDTVDDTVLLHKIILGEILKNATDLAQNEWGKKVLLWLVAPDNTSYFHPQFIKEIEYGRNNSTAKKTPEIRRKEILKYSIDTLLDLIVKEPKFWLEKPSRAVEMYLIIKAGGDESLKALRSIVKIITDPEWKLNNGKEQIYGIEDAGIHMTLKKLAVNDKTNNENGCQTSFGSCLVDELTEDVLNLWLTLNRGCFLLITILENSSEEVQKCLKQKLKGMKKLLKKQKTQGAEILLKKIE